MRSREVYVICKKESGNLKQYFKRVEAYYNSVLDVSEKNIDGILRFNNIYNSFYNYAKNIFKDIPFLNEILCIMDPLGKATLESNLFRKLDLANELIRRIDCIISLYEPIEKQDNENLGLDIKIPETDNITELKMYISELEFIFTKCPFFQSNEASLKLRNVDNGSIWLIIGVTCVAVAAGSVLLNNIAAFIDKCYVIKSHKLTCKRQEQEIEKLSCDQKEKEEILKSIRLLYKISVNNTIKDLESTTGYNIQDGDERGRVEQSFDKLEKLLDKGMQIYSSIDSPQEIKAIFAPIEMHYLSVADGLKMIEEKSNTETDGNE